ncbi:RimK family alpha-L-glutamate ligase [Acinetobacter haemolyticus]|uniref:RimK family alpha-L-glutamate ligase n=1 Tax=Acinetobacter haemolyticus TaxID=29430 RepID=UPI0034CFDBA1
MKLAIHHRNNSFSDRWIQFCQENNIDFKIVDAFHSNIIDHLKDCDAFMWHHHHVDFKDVIVAKKILFALEHANIKVFPDFKTGWHFDDKVAQKYLLEAINAPLVPSYVFYDKQQALNWAKETTYPKVFKLKGGAGASNVKLVRSYSQAIALINTAFGCGFAQFDRLGYFKERFNKFKNGKDNFIGVLKGFARIFIVPKFAKQQPTERGYIYFQEFIPNNDSDIRVIVIGNKAFAIKRMVRENDFRASGSGNIVYDKNEINLSCVNLAFEVNRKIESVCTAFDFVIHDGKPLIVEISYGFAISAYDNCSGYWDHNLHWYESKFNPQEWILNNLISRLK